MAHLLKRKFREWRVRKKINENRKIIQKCYVNLLRRVPDIDGMNIFLERMTHENYDEEQLIKDIRDSEEFLYLDAIPLERDGLSFEKWMKRDWNLRTEVDTYYFIGFESPNRELFWEMGKNRVKKYQETILKNYDTDKMKALEVGCGIGRLLIPLSKIFEETIGVDISENMVKKCKENINDIANCNVMVNNGLDFENLESNYFDFCLVNTVFQHIPKKEIIINYIKEIHKVLKPGGIFHFNIYTNDDVRSNRFSPNTRFGVTFSTGEIFNILENNEFKILKHGKEQFTNYNITAQKKSN